MIPNDPVMLLSFVNMKLRDKYNSFDELCAEMSLNREEILDKLAAIDYEYDSVSNQFK